MTNLEEFWESKHVVNDSTWVTGNNLNSLKNFYDVTPDDFKGKQCLEIGVGQGTLTKELTNLASSLYCCDISNKSLAKIKELATEIWNSKDIVDIPPVDVAISHLVFVHCDDAECIRILRSVKLSPDGRFFCQFSCFVDTTLGATQASQKVQEQLDIGVKHFFRTPNEIEKLITDAGLITIKVKKCNPGSYHGWNGQYWQCYELQRKN
jgi:2-polyprenyl-3-methyl-5-hydroxy-6-metoxy-1,4-benzoquinol methylase